MTTVLDHVASKTEELSQGSFIIKVHYGEAVSPSRQNLDSLSIRLVDAAQTCSSYHPGKTPAMTALELPFLPMDDIEHTIRVHTAFYHLPQVQSELARWQAEYLFLVPTPQPEFMGAGRPPMELSDWAGMRLRATGGLAHAMIELDAIPIGAPPPEVYLGLERKLFRAAAFPYTYAFGAYRLYEVSDWYTTNLKPAGFNCPVLVNSQSLAALSSHHRNILFEAIDTAYAAQTRAFELADQRWLQVFAKEGLTPVTYTPDQLQDFRALAAEPVWRRWREAAARRGVDGDAIFKDLFEIIERERRERIMP